jgi:TonB family protein
MLNKNRSSQISMMKYGLIAPLFVLMIVVSSATLASKGLAKMEEKTSRIAKEVLSDENLDLADEVAEPAPFNKYLMKNLRYPSEARKRLITGISYIGFTVNNSGKILNIKTLKEKSSILSEEVKRVLQSIENTNTLDLSEPNDYVISVNFGLEVSNGNETNELFSSEPNINFEGRKKLDDIVVMGYAEKVLRESKQDSIYNKIDQQAEFPGGMKEFVKYLRANVKYPAPAQRANISGKVYTQFIVNKDGSASDFKTLESIGYGCDEEAMRVIQSVPKWTPGKHKGEVVSSIFIVPISFRLSK